MDRQKPFDLSNRTILVTGASSGIGRESAVVLSELGARVILTGRRVEALDETRRRMTAGEHGTEPFDLANLEAIPAWIKRLATQYGPLDGVVHAAGIQKMIALRALSVPLIENIFEVNVHSAFMLSKGVRQKGCCGANGSIVLISSVTALAGAPATSVYAASKAALHGLCRSLASELAPEGIRVNCVAPGMVQSEMADQFRHVLSDDQFDAIVAQHPLGLGSPWDVACAAAYLLSDAARWMTGATIVLDGGFCAQ